MITSVQNEQLKISEVSVFRRPHVLIGILCFNVDQIRYIVFHDTLIFSDELESDGLVVTYLYQRYVSHLHSQYSLWNCCQLIKFGYIQYAGFKIKYISGVMDGYIPFQGESSFVRPFWRAKMKVFLFKAKTITFGLNQLF